MDVSSVERMYIKHSWLKLDIVMQPAMLMATQEPARLETQPRAAQLSTKSPACALLLLEAPALTPLTRWLDAVTPTSAQSTNLALQGARAVR